MPRQSFQVSEILPNPFRKIESYPYHPEKLEQLRESIRSTGFWDNVVGRLNEDGEPEIAYGHHRLEAVRRELGETAEVELILRDLSDDDMLRIMARENMEEWGTSVWVEMETVKSAVEAYAEGRISLPEVPGDANRRYLRYAPGFIKGDARPDRAAPYTATTLAAFLGWQKPSGEPAKSVKIALSALEMVEAGVLEESDLQGLSREAAKEAIRGARRVKRRKEEAAAIHEQDAETADKQAEAAETEEERQRARRRSEAARQKAERLRKEGEKAEKKAAKSVTKKLRDGSIGTKQARREAEKAAKQSDRKERVVHAREVAERISKRVHDVLRKGGRGSLAEELDELVRLRELLDPNDREEVAKNLDRMAEKAGDYAAKMRESVESDTPQLQTA